MDKNKIISILFWVAVVGSILFGIYRFFIARNFMVVYQIDCDPAAEKCFVWQCDEALGECTGDEEEDVWYYSKVKKMARDTAKCDPRKGDCPDESICDQPITQKCWIEKCNENNLGEDEKCITPEVYLQAHPEALLEEEVEEEAVDEETVGAEEEGEEPVEGETVVEESSTETLPLESETTPTITPTNKPLIPSVSPISPSPTPTETVVPY